MGVMQKGMYGRSGTRKVGSARGATDRGEIGLSKSRSCYYLFRGLAFEMLLLFIYSADLQHDKSNFWRLKV